MVESSSGKIGIIVSAPLEMSECMQISLLLGMLLVYLFARLEVLSLV